MKSRRNIDPLVPRLAASARRILAAGGAYVYAPLVAARDAYRIYHPVPTSGKRTPADRGMPTREIALTATRDRVRLRGWIVPGRGPHTVIVAHGESLRPGVSAPWPWPS